MGKGASFFDTLLGKPLPSPGGEPIVLIIELYGGFWGVESHLYLEHNVTLLRLK